MPDGLPPSGHVWFDSSKAGVNVDDEKRLDNIRHNIRRSIIQAQPGPRTDFEAILACGGPSLKTHLKTIRRLYNKGAKLITVNNTHDFMIGEGFSPFAHVMIDSRPWNARFVQNPTSTCRYMIASQCDPAVFDALEGYSLGIFHALCDSGEQEVLDEYYGKDRYMTVGGGTTVGCRAIVLLTMVGINKFHIFGMDCCYFGNRHHSYAQVENDDASALFRIADKYFRCAPWMVRQHEDFLRMMREAGDTFHCRVYGRGVIAHALQTGAALEEAKEISDGTR